MQPIVRHSRAAADTRAMGEAIGARVRPGDVLALSGDLGAGKTTMVQGIAHALGINQDVTSPTFVLMRQYEGRLPLFHVDVYRMNRLDELLDIGFEEALDAPGVVLVEWGDVVEGLLPDERLEVWIRVEPTDERVLEIVPRGAGWGARAAEVAEATERWAEA